MMKFRDYTEDDKLYTFKECEEPAFLVGLDSEVRLKYGEYEELLTLMDKYSILERVAVIKLPKNQEELDDIFQSTGLTKKLISSYKKINKI